MNNLTPYKLKVSNEDLEDLKIIQKNLHVLGIKIIKENAS